MTSNARKAHPSSPSVLAILRVLAAADRTMTGAEICAATPEITDRQAASLLGGTLFHAGYVIERSPTPHRATPVKAKTYTLTDAGRAMVA